LAAHRLRWYRSLLRSCTLARGLLRHLRQGAFRHGADGEGRPRSHLLQTDTYLDPDGKPKAIRRDISFICWRAPDQANRQWYGDLHAETKAWKRTISGDDNIAADNSATPTGEPTFHIAETHATAKPGIVVFYTGGYYFWVPPLRAGEGLVDNHMAKLLAVQEGQGKIVRELGTRTIEGRDARGYVVDFEDAVPFKGYGPVEVWLDPQTDLPIELSFKWNEHTDKMIDESRITDIRWSIDFPPDQFATVAPADLVDSTPPVDEHDVSQIVSALKLYAELSGGHYPRVRTTDRDQKYDPALKTDPPNTFDGKVVRSEMLRLAGFTGPPQSDWSRDPKYQRIEAATPGLDWLTRVLIDSYRAGFFGAEVGPQDKDKVLLWWMAGTEDDQGNYDPDGFFRVFYGDLRTEIIPDAEFIKLVPAAVET
jgi:hypothetical protein